MARMFKWDGDYEADGSPAIREPNVAETAGAPFGFNPRIIGGPHCRDRALLGHICSAYIASCGGWEKAAGWAYLSADLRVIPWDDANGEPPEFRDDYGRTPPPPGWVKAVTSDKKKFTYCFLMPDGRRIYSNTHYPLRNAQ